MRKGIITVVVNLHFNKFQMSVFERIFMQDNFL